MEKGAFSALGHFFRPVCRRFSTAKGTVDEPAAAALMKFEGWALPLHGSGAFAGLPAVFSAALRCGGGQQKEHLPLCVGRDVSPSLLEALHRLDGRAQQRGKLPLRLFQIDSNSGKLFRIHMLGFVTTMCDKINSFRGKKTRIDPRAFKKMNLPLQPRQSEISFSLKQAAGDQSGI
jgi:hypothetical protein